MSTGLGNPLLYNMFFLFLIKVKAISKIYAERYWFEVLDTTVSHLPD